MAIKPGWREEHLGTQWDLRSKETVNMLNAVELFTRKALFNRDQPAFLILVGMPQTGKTQLAKAAFEYWRRGSITAYDSGRWKYPPKYTFAPWSDLANVNPEDRSKIYLWEDLSKAQLAVIDDIGSEVDRFKSGQTTENLRLILEARLTGRKFTIITTNIPPTQWDSKWDIRVTGRLLRDYKLVSTLNTESFSKTR